MTDRARPVPEAPAAGLLRLALPSDTLPPYDHTNTYVVVAAGLAAVVDPGFRDDDGAHALFRALEQAGVRDVRMVLLTHTHPDHLAGLPPVRERYGPVPAYVHPAEAERVPAGGPVIPLQDGRLLVLGGRAIRALHTPGHAPGHLAFELPDDGGLLCGDLLTKDGSTWVGLPEGDAGRYLASLERVASLGVAWLGPGHGPVLRDADAAIRRARERREQRAGRILEALDRPRTLPELRERVYPEVDERLRDRAEASLLAHLAHLMAQLRVAHLGDGPHGPFWRRD